MHQQSTIATCCKLLLSLAIITSPLSSFASSASHDGWWVNVEGGYGWGVTPHHTNVEAMPEVNLPDNYVSNQLGNNGTAGLGVGYQFIFSHTWLPANRLGLIYDYTSQTKLSGHIDKWQEVTTYNYHYQASANTLWIDDQLDLFSYNNFIPFLEVGIGSAWNQTSYYREAALSNVPLQDVRSQTAAFANHTQTEFAYRVGAGVNFRLTHQLNLGLQYRYDSLGSISTGNSKYYPTVANLDAPFRVNSVLLSLRYDI